MQRKVTKSEFVEALIDAEFSNFSRAGLCAIYDHLKEEGEDELSILVMFDIPEFCRNHREIKNERLITFDGGIIVNRVVE